VGRAPERLFYPTVFTPYGVRREPWPAFQKSWGAVSTLYRFDEVIVVRHATAGRLDLIERWPVPPLPNLPDGVRYDPAARIVHDAPRLPEHAILGAG
jgi:hypothetical protein